VGTSTKKGQDPRFLVLETNKPKRGQRFDKDLRMEIIEEIKELKTINKHIEIKQRCVDQKVVERKFDLCDMITGEIQELQSKRK